MMNKTIINIGSDGSSNVSYEEAFGDWSEARGDGRRRRQARRLERIANKREVKRAKREARQAAQQDRIEQRRMAMSSRQNIKTERKRNAQERKNEQQRYRQGRKDYNKTARVNRRGIGQEEEIIDDPTQDEVIDTAPVQDDGGVYSQDNGGNNYDDGLENEENGDNVPDDEYVDDIPEDSYENDDEFGGFDGAEEFSHEESPGSDFLDIEAMPVYKIALKSEQNKEAIELLNRKKQMLESKNIPCKGIDEEIKSRTIVVSNLEGQLQEYSSANGKNKGNATLAKWKAQVKRLEHKNKDGKLTNRIASRKAAIAKLEARISAAHAKKAKYTKVDPKLNASIKPNNITVPPQSSNASGGDTYKDIEHPYSNSCGCSTGFDGGEFDEGQSFASGKPSMLENINWKGVGIGLGISVLLIYGAQKMKLFSK